MNSFEKWAKIVKPVSAIAKDGGLMAEIEGKTYLEAFGVIVEKYPEQLKEIIAIYKDKDPKNYEPEFWELPAIAVEAMTGMGLMNFFTSASRKKDEKSSGDATESTEEQEITS